MFKAPTNTETIPTEAIMALGQTDLVPLPPTVQTDTSLTLHPNTDQPVMTPAAWQIRSLLSLPPDIDQVKMIAAVNALNPGGVIILHPDTDQVKMVATAAALKTGTLLILHPNTDQAKMIAAANALNPGTSLSFYPNTDQAKMVAAAAALNPGTSLSFCPNIDQAKMVAAAAALNPGTFLFIPSTIKRIKILALVNCLKPGVDIVQDPIVRSMPSVTTGISAGVGQKYLGTIPLLPMAQCPPQYLTVPAVPLNIQLNLVQLSSLAPQEEEPTCIPFDLKSAMAQGHPVGMLKLYTKKPAFSHKDKPIFIFAGRGLNAYIPTIQEDTPIRLILVITRGEYESLKDLIRPGLDLLVIDELNSPTHGQYDKVGLLNSRCIAAFICAIQLNCREAIMMDDNIEQLHFTLSQATAPHNWDTCFNQLARQLQDTNAVYSSLETLRTHQLYKIRKIGTLGSKVFMFNLNRLSPHFSSDVNHCFMPFFPSAANAFWGEDYYFRHGSKSAVFSEHWA